MLNKPPLFYKGLNLSEVEYATEQKLIEIALKNNFDITNYIKDKSL